MSFRTATRQLARAAARARQPPYSTIRHYSSSGTERPRKSPSFNENSRIWAIVLGTSTVIGMAVYSIAPTQAQASQPRSGSQGRRTSENFESTKDRGLQANFEPKQEDQDASQTTGANTRKGNTVESVSDAKGAQKKRISSQNGMKQGTADKAPVRGYEGVKDEAAASKPQGGQGTISGKQEGLSNSDTKYPIDLTNTPEKSQKAEGSPETSKSKGTIDSRRPLRY